MPADTDIHKCYRANCQNAIKVERLRWPNEVVIGLDLCPFARKPVSENRVRLVASEAKDDEALLEGLAREIALLDAAPVAELEIILVIIM